MKTIILSLLLAFAGVSEAQNYSIDWFTIDGGGGTSSGGPYTLTGTIGQPDAGRLSGGNYVVEGGFWGAFAIQTPGAPTLQIQHSGPNQVTISWTPNTPGFVLEESSSVAAPAWANSPSGAQNPVTVPHGGGIKFYRLRNP